MPIADDTQVWTDASGTAWIGDTGIKVIEVAMDWVANCSSAEEMHQEYPHLSVSQIQSALLFYHDHREAFDVAIAQSVRRVEEASRKAAESPARRKLKAAGLIR